MDFQDSGAQLEDPETKWVEEEEETAEGMVRKNLAALGVERWGLKKKHLAMGVVEASEEEVGGGRFAKPEMIIFHRLCDSPVAGKL